MYAHLHQPSVNFTVPSQGRLDSERLQPFENLLRDGPIDPHATEADTVADRQVAERAATNISLRIAAFPRVLNADGSQQWHRDVVSIKASTRARRAQRSGSHCSDLKPIEPPLHSRSGRIATRHVGNPTKPLRIATTKYVQSRRLTGAT